MNSRGAVRKIASVLLGAVLFAQAALAIGACDWARRAPALAIAQAGQPAPGLECPMPERNVNLCLAHCLGADQSADTPQVAIPAWSQASVLVFVDFESAPAPKSILRYTLPHPGALPPRILYHSFLI